MEKEICNFRAECIVCGPILENSENNRTAVLNHTVLFEPLVNKKLI